MPLLTEIIIVTFVIFLYFLFSFAKEDFVLLRKNVTLEQLFNIAVVGLLLSMFLARLGYVILFPKALYLQPLVFFAFPYFPGLSFTLAYMGSIGYLWYMTKIKKLPFGKITDIYTPSFFLSFPFGSFLFFLAQLLLKKILMWELLLATVLMGISSALLSWQFNKGKRKDGSITALGLSLFSFIQLLTTIPLFHLKQFHITPEQIVYALMMLSGIVYLFLKENVRKK